jgi:hypothetical protein
VHPIRSWKYSGQRAGKKKPPRTGAGRQPDVLAGKQVPTSCPQRRTVSATGVDVKAIHRCEGFQDTLHFSWPGGRRPLGPSGR